MISRLDTASRELYRFSMTQKKTVEVVVGQQRLLLRTDGDSGRVTKVAEFVNKRLADIIPPSQPLSHQVLLLLAMNLAEDLMAKSDENARFKSQVKERSQALLTQLEREFPV
jgi:cell division protein ZapA (FtsZ GTPase activity inhibitor)